MAKAKIIQFPGCTPSPEVTFVDTQKTNSLSSGKRVNIWADMMKFFFYTLQIVYLTCVFLHR